MLQNGQRVCRLAEECLCGARTLQKSERAHVLATLHRHFTGPTPPPKFFSGKRMEAEFALQRVRFYIAVVLFALEPLAGKPNCSP